MRGLACFGAALLLAGPALAAEPPAASRPEMTAALALAAASGLMLLGWLGGWVVRWLKK